VDPPASVVDAWIAADDGAATTAASLVDLAEALRGASRAPARMVVRIWGRQRTGISLRLEDDVLTVRSDRAPDKFDPIDRAVKRHVKLRKAPADVEARKAPTSIFLHPVVVGAGALVLGVVGTFSLAPREVADSLLGTSAIVVTSPARIGQGQFRSVDATCQLCDVEVRIAWHINSTRFWRTVRAADNRAHVRAIRTDQTIVEGEGDGTATLKLRTGAWEVYVETDDGVSTTILVDVGGAEPLPGADTPSTGG
jgi:hypothetical protein